MKKSLTALFLISTFVFGSAFINDNKLFEITKNIEIFTKVYQELNASHVWMLQRVFQNDFAGNLAFDTNGDGSFDSLRKLELLQEAVLLKCDANDGIRDGVIDDPLSCAFKPEVDLADKCLGN